MLVALWLNQPDPNFFWQFLVNAMWIHSHPKSLIKSICLLHFFPRKHFAISDRDIYFFEKKNYFDSSFPRVKYTVIYFVIYFNKFCAQYASPIANILQSIHVYVPIFYRVYTFMCQYSAEYTRLCAIILQSMTILKLIFCRIYSSLYQYSAEYARRSPNFLHCLHVPELISYIVHMYECANILRSMHVPAPIFCRVCMELY